MVNGSEGWEPVQRLRTHEQVMAQIEERILDGRLQAGDRLPNERELATQLGVSRPSLRETLRVLEALGVVTVRRGGGPDGGSTLERVPGDGLGHLLKLEIALAHFSWDEVLETRLMMESWSAQEAAHEAGDQDHKALSEILDRMDDATIDSAEFNRLDALFHVQIALSTGNRLTTHFMSALRSAIHQQMVQVYADLDDWRATAVSVRAEHRDILRAIVQRDAPLAVDRMRRHIADFYRLDLRDGGTAPS